MTIGVLALQGDVREHTAALADLGELARPVRQPADLDGVFVGDRTVLLQASHTVAGNPDRLRRGEVVLRLDDEWRERMSRRDRAMVGAMTAPVRSCLR